MFFLNFGSWVESLTLRGTLKPLPNVHIHASLPNLNNPSSVKVKILRNPQLRRILPMIFM